jgi:alpha-L-fucosidase 2
MVGISCWQVQGLNSKHPANLQGIWNNQLNPPWGSKYTSNINLQMNYWPAESLNLSESTAPLFNAIQELSQTGKATAQAHYGAEGWVLHHNTDLWRGTAPINAANHGIWVTGGAWLCLHIWEHYLFTQDKAFLKQNYPILKSASTFFTQFLSRDPVSGKLISSPSNSPENGGSGSWSYYGSPNHSGIVQEYSSCCQNTWSGFRFSTIVDQTV